MLLRTGALEDEGSVDLVIRSSGGEGTAARMVSAMTIASARM